MGLQKFDLAALADIDGGRVAAAFKHALGRCEADCKDRPVAQKPRVITLTMEMVPECTVEGDLRSVDVVFKVKDSVPTRVSNTYNMKAGRGGLVFNELSPDEVDQLTIDDVGPRAASFDPETGEVTGDQQEVSDVG